MSFQAELDSMSAVIFISPHNTKPLAMIVMPIVQLVLLALLAPAAAATALRPVGPSVD